MDDSTIARWTVQDLQDFMNQRSVEILLRMGLHHCENLVEDEFKRLRFQVMIALRSSYAVLGWYFLRFEPELMPLIRWLMGVSSFLQALFYRLLLPLPTSKWFNYPHD